MCHAMEVDQKISQTMMDFIQAHPSCYHVAEGLAQILEESGFERLYENERWELQAGRDYYIGEIFVQTDHVAPLLDRQTAIV